MTDDTTAARQAEERRWALMRAGDSNGLGDLFSDALLYAHSDSSVDDKASYLQAITDGSLVYDTVDCAITDASSASGCTVFMGTMQADVAAQWQAAETQQFLCHRLGLDPGRSETSGPQVDAAGVNEQKGEWM